MAEVWAAAVGAPIQKRSRSNHSRGNPNDSSDDSGIHTFLTKAVGDMCGGYEDASGRVSPNFTELGAGEIGGLALFPGLYKWSTDLLITTDVTLNGGPNDVWIFQVAGSLSQANAVRMTLAGGARAKNVFWQVAGPVTIGTTAHFEGVVLAKTLIAVNTGAPLRPGVVREE